jgi:hypothetical protein
MGVSHARMMFGFLFLCLFLFGSDLVAASISPISVKGTKLYDDDGNQFFVRGTVNALSMSRAAS